MHLKWAFCGMLRTYSMQIYDIFSPGPAKPSSVGTESCCTVSPSLLSLPQTPGRNSFRSHCPWDGAHRIHAVSKQTRQPPRTSRERLCFMNNGDSKPFSPIHKDSANHFDFRFLIGVHEQTSVRQIGRCDRVGAHASMYNNSEPDVLLHEFFRYFWKATPAPPSAARCLSRLESEGSTYPTEASKDRA